jgi:hypothetical protein
VADKVNKETVKDMVFTVYGGPIKIVTEFKYLGRVVEKKDDDWPAVNRNMRKHSPLGGNFGASFHERAPNPR